MLVQYVLRKAAGGKFNLNGVRQLPLRILELGSGTGYAGLAIAKGWAKCTESDSTSLEFETSLQVSITLTDRLLPAKATSKRTTRKPRGMSQAYWA